MSYTIDGKRFRKATPFRHNQELEARRYLSKHFEEALNRHTFGVKPEITLEITLKDACDRAMRGKTRKTLDSYKLCSKKLLGGLEGAWGINPDLKMQRFTQDHVDDLIAYRMAEGLSNNSVNVELRFARLMYNGVRKRYLVDDSLEFKLLQGFFKTRYLTGQEELDILGKLRSEATPAYVKAADLCVVLFDTGARVNEVLQSEWPEVDLMSGRMEVFRQKTKSVSKIPLTPRVIEVFERRHNQKRPFEEMTRAVRLLRGAISDACNGNQTINQRRGRATIHTLRDTYATRLQQKGMSLNKIAKLMGHTTEAMTRKYAHLEYDEVADEARRLLSL